MTLFIDEMESRGYKLVKFTPTTCVLEANGHEGSQVVVSTGQARISPETVRSSLRDRGVDPDEIVYAVHRRMQGFEIDELREQLAMSLEDSKKILAASPDPRDRASRSPDDLKVASEILQRMAGALPKDADVNDASRDLDKYVY